MADDNAAAHILVTSKRPFFFRYVYRLNYISLQGKLERNAFDVRLNRANKLLATIPTQFLPPILYYMLSAQNVYSASARPVFNMVLI